MSNRTPYEIALDEIGRYIEDRDVFVKAAEDNKRLFVESDNVCTSLLNKARENIEEAKKRSFAIDALVDVTAKQYNVGINQIRNAILERRWPDGQD